MFDFILELVYRRPICNLYELIIAVHFISFHKQYIVASSLNIITFNFLNHTYIFNSYCANSSRK
jgi:hypothetical protein